MDAEPKRLGAFPFVIGGLSFIPLVGVLFGIVAILWGVLTKRTGGKKLVLVGALGIVFTFSAYSGLFYFGMIQRGGIYDDLRTRTAQDFLNELVPSIEFYKIQHGAYPESLEELRKSFPKDTLVPVYDPISQHWGSTSQYFYYKRVGTDHYYLRSVGPDGIPFTADDVVPQINNPPSGNVGLLTTPPAK